MAVFELLFLIAFGRAFFASRVVAVILRNVLGSVDGAVLLLVVLLLLSLLVLACLVGDDGSGFHAVVVVVSVLGVVDIVGDSFLFWHKMSAIHIETEYSATQGTVVGSLPFYVNPRPPRLYVHKFRQEFWSQPYTHLAYHVQGMPTITMFPPFAGPRLCCPRTCDTHYKMENICKDKPRVLFACHAQKKNRFNS